jgi:peroxiredoxin
MARSPDIFLSKNHDIYVDRFRYSLTEAMQDFHEAIGLDLASFNGTTQLELLLPATYIVDDGIVVARVDLDFRYRMDPLDIIAALQKLGK